jgi:nucleoside-diphosphate-sugar epimerase
VASLLLIGGTGFFGKSFLDSFQRGDLNAWGIDKVIAMSRSADQLKQAAPQLLDPRVELINADIGTVNSLPAADYVVHAAASTDARNYLSRPESERKNIQAGVLNYCRLAPKFHKNSKIVYVSSGAVYGVQPKEIGFLSEDAPTISLEDMPEHKRDYAMAKRDAEEAIFQLSKEHEMNASIARCFAFVGPWLPRDQHFAIGNFIEDGLQGRPIQVKATYPVYRSYMHSDDLVTWLMTMAANADTQCEAFNVGSDHAVDMGELARLVAKQLNAQAVIPLHIKTIYDRYIPSVQKARSKLGLDLKLDLPNAIRSTIDSICA